ncbi:hypothetical protein [Flavobacterium sp. NKUCC04_CG]|uniref:hypothetical protein n=1 Tax=Flavobacterium sp. NKUCC04_CG TaxID=2842121 RepID=UPI001C5B5991|nr:hypothetical protein [Flavobacterium sp. NKUCC04_CG]MBW3519197.1 hypothetical protein [Flavobacterium sp. NKUCC04_CG]
MLTKPLHTFHIPVMGLAYTIDSPIRVAKYGISSVISVMDDELMEKMNHFYSEKFGFPYQEISKKVEDFRCKRITSYLNLVDKIVKQKFSQWKTELFESKKALENYIDMLPRTSEIRQELQNYLHKTPFKENFKNFIEQNLKPGAIDVNIMTKVDKENFNKNAPLDTIYNDAHAALRGFAQSNLCSSVVLSAGMNPRLFSYFETFEDFYPNASAALSKKIILKVSDYRSALIQGSFLAKKGLWVSEYRIESGLNCGGHAFATDGFLLGPILEEFKQKRSELVQTTHELMCKALAQKGKWIPESPLQLDITAQGGVGTAEEHEFLLHEYQLSSVGWGSPFLLVPEATSVDKETRQLLQKATEKDLYLSNLSPLGIPFNTVKGMSNDFFRSQRISKDKAGSSCPRKYLALNKDYSNQGLCTASKKFQDIKIKELQGLKDNMPETAYNDQYQSITEKACLCIGLANASLLEHELPVKGEAQGIVICPGPNMAYFDKEVSLKTMIQHIYHRGQSIIDGPRPHFFIKELRMYRDHFVTEKRELLHDFNAMKEKKLGKFKQNLLDGITYYQNLFMLDTLYFYEHKQLALDELNQIKMELNQL